MHWGMYYTFFVSKTTQNRMINIVLSTVREIMYSAMTCFVLNNKEKYMMDAHILNWGRTLLKGRATERGEHGKYKYKGNMHVWRQQKRGDAGIELIIRRLRMWQAISKEPSNDELLLGACFGIFEIENNK